MKLKVKVYYTSSLEREEPKGSFFFGLRAMGRRAQYFLIYSQFAQFSKQIFMQFANSQIPQSEVYFNHRKEQNKNE